jgi:hypothetical protein
MSTSAWTESLIKEVAEMVDERRRLQHLTKAYRLANEEYFSKSKSQAIIMAGQMTTMYMEKLLADLEAAMQERGIQLSRPDHE